MGRLAIFFVVLGVAVGCTSTDWESRYLEEEQENRALQEALDYRTQRMAEEDASADVLRDEMSRTKDRIDTLSEEIRRLEDRPQPVAEPARDLENEKLRAEYERLKTLYGELVRITEDGNIEITLDANVTFASGSYALTDEGKRIVGTVARELNGQFAGNRVEIVGHTDTDPIRKSPFKDNWELGAERAAEVVRHLTTLGVDGTRMKASSMGPNSPIADNTTKEGKRKNRRVEIIVIMPRPVIEPEFGKR